MLSRLAAPLRKLESIEGSFSQKRDGRDHSSEHSGDQGGGVFASEGLCVIGGGGGSGFGDEGRAEAAAAAAADDATVSAPSIRRTSDVRHLPHPPPTHPPHPLTPYPLPLTPSPLTHSRAQRRLLTPH